jgi:hypothetical protein
MGLRSRSIRSRRTDRNAGRHFAAPRAGPDAHQPADQSFGDTAEPGLSRFDDDFHCRVRAENVAVPKVMFRVPMANAPPDLAEKVKAKVIGQVSKIADRVCDRMLVATSAVLLKNRNGLGGPDDIHSRTFTGTSGSYACVGLGTTCRG